MQQVHITKAPAGYYLQGFFFAQIHTTARPSRKSKCGHRTLLSLASWKPGKNMPSAAPKPCGHPGCGVLVRDGTSRCPKHPKANSFADKRRGNRHERGYGSAWDKLRAFVLARDEGLCQSCVKAHRVSLAKEVDHVVPKAEGGTDCATNLQSICRACHLDKTSTEAKRGVDRGWGASKV